MIALAALALVCLQGLSVVPAAAEVSARSSARCDVVVSIPSIDVREEMRYYPGSPDDAVGTRIQNAGRLASPLGGGGGVRAGEVGNHFIAGHRTSAGAPLLHLRKLKIGHRVVVAEKCEGTGTVTHTYTVTARSRYIDFFTRQGRAAQIAPVPFQPGAEPTAAMVTLSTCATQEDRARGDMRKDRFGNPPGRWVVVGVLESTVVG